MIDTFVRALRGVIRSPIRSLLVIVLLAAGLAFALTSLALAFAAGDELDRIKQTTGTEAGVAIHPDQFTRAVQSELARAQSNNGEFDSSRIARQIKPLTTEDADRIAALPYVVAASVNVYAAAAVEYELPGREAGRENDFAFGTLRIPIPDATVNGTGDGNLLAEFQSGAADLKEGRMFGPEDAGKDVIVIDRDTAAFEELKLGDRIIVKSQALPDEGEAPPAQPEYRQVEAEIIGLYADVAGATQGGFAPGRIEAWYAPIDLVRKLQAPDSQDGLTKIAFKIDSVDSAESLRADVSQLLDGDDFLLTTTQRRFEEISDPVESMRGTSLLGTIIGLLVVSLIMVLLMALVIRGRMREIGILKAVGARNRHVILQFAAETVGIALAAVIVAVPIAVAANPLVADAFRGDPSVQRQATDENSLGPGIRAVTGAPVVADVKTKDVKQALDQVDASLDSEIIVLAAAIAVGLGLVGALVPIIAVMRLRPAEVLRLEA